MKIVAGSDLYIRIRQNWLNTQDWPDCGVDDARYDFEKLIKGYCVTRRSPEFDYEKMYAVDCLGYIPDIDEFHFVSEQKYIEFVLRWE